MAEILFFTNMERYYLMLSQGIEKNKTVVNHPASAEVFLIHNQQPWNTEWQKKIHDAKIVIIPWMGVGLDTDFLKHLSKQLIKNRRPYLFLMENINDDSFVQGVTLEEVFQIRSYLGYGGIENSKNLQLWLSSCFCEKECSFDVPQSLPWNGIYHPKAEQVYEKIEDYWQRFCNPDYPTVGLVFYRSEWIVGELFYQDEIIEQLEKNKMNVIAVFSNTASNSDLGNDGFSGALQKFFYLDNKCLIDVLVSTFKFSLTTSQGVQIKQLQELNIPILEAHTLSLSPKQWEESTEGVTPVDVSLNICMPEFDGVIHSSVVAGKEQKSSGTSFYAPISERISMLIQKAKKWSSLKNKKNQEKKIAVIFHNYPATNSNIGSAAGLDSPESVWILLKNLQKQGYVVDYIPENSQVFMEEITANATNDRRYITEKQIQGAYGHLKKEEYQKFFESIPNRVQEKLRIDWGEEPGEVFLCDEELLIPGIINGNIFITVQPPRGFDEDPSKLLHSPDAAPPHHYLGYYHWIRDIWQADAVIHVGTHGSLEWLPGKSAALSNACYPDISIGDLPNIYPYWITIVGEGIQAKRRSSACLISHLSPPMSRSELYDELEELEKTLDEYYYFQSAGNEISDSLRELIEQKAKAANLVEEIEALPEENFDQYVGALHDYVTDIKNMQIRTGLHILGKAPEGESLEGYVSAITRLENKEIPSLVKMIAELKGFEYYELLENSGEKNEHGMLYSHLIEEIEKESREFIALLGENHFSQESTDIIFSLKWLKDQDQEQKGKFKSIAQYICAVLVPNLAKTSQEITNLLSALEGKYIEPSAAGAPTSGGADILPTGRNFYGMDPRALPTQSAWEVGKQLADQAIQRFMQEEGRYPESIGLILWAGANMRSQGQCIAEFLYLLGVRPVWQKGSLKVIDLEVMPLDELKRPRIDVTGRISGFFRDSMPGVARWMDHAVHLVADLEENPEENYIRKHVLEDTEKLTAEGIEEVIAKKQAMYRIFGDPPGAYGTGVAALLESKEWESVHDLANVYVRFSGNAYTESGENEYAPEIFKMRMQGLDITIKNEDNREATLLSSDDFNAYHGGMIAAVRSIKGEAPKSYSGDSSDRSKVKLRSLDEEVRRLVRGEALNPKYIEGMKKHGYKGAQDLANYLVHSFQWDATSEVLEDWIYEKYAEKYALDSQMQEWMREVNPWALNRIAETLLEAEQRGMWNANEDTKKELEKLFLSIEGDLEERAED